MSEGVEEKAEPVARVGLAGWVVMASMAHLELAVAKAGQRERVEGLAARAEAADVVGRPPVAASTTPAPW